MDMRTKNTHTRERKAMTNLFIPLKHCFYDDFIKGNKQTEYRLFGPRWNHKTCFVGRSVTLSSGYGKSKRAYTAIKAVEIKKRYELSGDVQDAIIHCYTATPETEIICIHMEPVHDPR